MKIAGDSQAPAFNPAKNTGKADSAPVKQAAHQTINQSVKSPSAAASLSNLLALLKLPQDNLSRSIIAFARFFSLPLEPELLNSLRREALSQGGKGAAFKESAALGAAAAADKGLKLDGKALGEYAAAIEGSIKSFSKEEDPPRAYYADEKEGHDSSGQDRQSENQGENSSRPDTGGGNYGNNKHDRKEKHNSGDDSGDSLIIEHLAKTLNEKPLLDLLNRVPGKKGRWIVIPFSFFQKGYEFNVSLRILLNNANSAEAAVFDYLTLDISVKEKQKRLFIRLERPKSAEYTENTAGGGLMGSRVSIFTEARTQAEQNRLRRDLAKALNLPVDNVKWQNKPLLFADSRDDHLRFVDEEV